MLVEKLFYKTGKLFVRLYAFVAFKIDLVQEGEIPAGPKIFVANHPSTTDPFLTTILTKDKICILVKGILFEIPLFGRYLAHAGHIRVIKDEPHLAYQQAKTKLLAGQSLFLFIEGDISPGKDSYLKPKTGAVRLALETGAPIIPLGFGIHHSHLKRTCSTIGNCPEPGYWYFKGPYAVTIGPSKYIKGSSSDRPYVTKESQKLLNRVAALVIHSQQRLASQSSHLGFFHNLDHLIRVRPLALRILNQLLLFLPFLHR